MMVPVLSENVDCPRDEIASYIDGELSQSEEAAFETHLSECETCRSELKYQKEFLFALSASLDSEQDIPLPKDFTRTIVANAESRVSGLRRPRERFTAIFICAALFLFALFALGGNAETVWNAFGSIGEKAYSIGAFIVRVLYSISIGIAVVVRSLASHISTLWLLTLPVVASMAAGLFFFSRSVIRGRRVQEN